MNKLRRARTIGLLLASTLAFAFACSKDDNKSNCDSGDCGGNAGSGGEDRGKTSKGGSTTGGKSSSAGGATSEGGTTAAGGTTSTESGGSSAQGGTTESGGTTSVGGTTAAGGTSSVGGTTAAGGTTSAPPPPGVAILKYDFEDGTGTTVSDTSGHSNTGTVAGATWTPNTDGRNGGAINFAAKNDAVKVPANLFANASGLVVAAWVKLSANEAENRLFDFGSSVGNHIYLALKNGAGVMEFGVQLATGDSETVTTTATLPLNVWKHVAVVMGSGGTRIYVDGWQVAKNTSLKVAPSALGDATSSFIGKSQIPEHPTFAGQIDEFYVYDNPISLADIRQLAWPKHDYSIWHFDEDLGTTAKDSSDFKRDATMVRATFNDGVVGNAAQLYNPSDLDEPPPNEQYVQLPEGVVKDCTQGYTVATWVKLAAKRTHARVFEFSDNDKLGIFGRTMGGWTEHWSAYDGTDGTLPSSIKTNYGELKFMWSANLGAWKHLAVVRNDQTLSVYMDGAQGTTGDVPFTQLDQDRDSQGNLIVAPHPAPSSMGSTLYNYIGRTRDTAWSNERRRLHGSVDEFLLSCRPYTADEIKLLATRP
jgi:hypothetical protein